MDRERIASEQSIDDAIGEAFYDFIHNKSKPQCIRAIRDAFLAAGYTRPAEPACGCPEMRD